jgi:hypothetical protein
MVDEASDSENTEELEPRAPERADLVALCAALNAGGAKYLVVGGFAVILTGLPRTTGDIDLLVDTSLENEAKIFKALEILPEVSKSLILGMLLSIQWFVWLMKLWSI